MMKRLNNKSKRKQIPKPNQSYRPRSQTQFGNEVLGKLGFGHWDLRVLELNFQLNEVIDYERIDSYT